MFSSEGKKECRKKQKTTTPFFIIACDDEERIHLTEIPPTPPAE
jgi:hypothetical protein